MNIEGDQITFPRTAAYGGAVSIADIHRALRWGRDYDRNRWQWEVFPPPEAANSPETNEQPDIESLLIGVGAYDNLTRLPAEKDIEQLMGVIGGTPLIDPSWSELVKEIDVVFSRSASRTVLLYFSGHAEVKGDELYLMLRQSCASNAFTTALPVHKLLALQFERNVKELIILLDCCYSSAAAEDLNIDIKHIQVWFEKLPDDVRGRVSLVAASRIDQEALASSGGSLFTGCLAAAAATACDSSGVLRLSEWYDEASRLFSAYGLEQVPSYFAPCDPRQVLLLKGRAERIGLMSKYLFQRAELKLEGQEKTLKRFASFIETQMKASSPGVYQIELRSPGVSPGEYSLDDKGFVVRSKQPFEVEEYTEIRARRRVALGFLYSGVAGLVLLGLFAERSGQQSFIFRHSVGLFVLTALIALLGLFLFLIAGGTKQIYLLVVQAGVVCQLNTQRSLIPGYLITDALTDGSTFYTPMGGAVRRSEIVLRTRNGEKMPVCYEVSESTQIWPIAQRDLLAKLNPFVEIYLRDASNYDRESMTMANSKSANDQHPGL
jgi:hypothetical protein